MARAASLTIVSDERFRKRERETSGEVLEKSAETTARAREVAARLRSMTELYQARLTGAREPRRPPSL